jgi:Holliday junction resolvase
MPINKKIGNDFEREFCELLAAEGFWVHNLAMNSAGQPADVIAVRNGEAFLIDCKHCTGKGFDLRRIEENQQFAMKLWEERGNGVGWFALKVKENIYMMCYEVLCEARNHFTTIPNDVIETIGIRFEEWVKC